MVNATACKLGYACCGKKSNVIRDVYQYFLKKEKVITKKNYNYKIFSYLQIHSTKLSFYYNHIQSR